MGHHIVTCREKGVCTLGFVLRVYGWPDRGVEDVAVSDYCFGPGEVFCGQLVDLVAVFDSVFGHFGDDFFFFYLGRELIWMDMEGGTYLIYQRTRVVEIVAD